MQHSNGFEGKRVVILGGSSGIGLAVAEHASAQGAEVVIVSSNAERVQEAVRSIGGNVRGEAVDVFDEKSVESFFTNIGAFDHLVFTAGDSLTQRRIVRAAPLLKTPSNPAPASAPLNPTGVYITGLL